MPMFWQNKHILKPPYCILMHLLPRKELITFVLHLGGEGGIVKMGVEMAICRRRHFQNHTSKVGTIKFFLSENEFLKKIFLKVFIYFCYDQKKKVLPGLVFSQSLLAFDYMQNPLHLWRPQQSTARRPRKNP